MMLKSIKIALVFLLNITIFANTFGGGGGGVKPEQRQVLERDLNHNLIVIQVDGRGGVGTSGTPGSITERLQELRYSGAIGGGNRTTDGGVSGGTSTKKDSVEVKISDLYELTLKDGTVIKADEIKEFFKK
ncbi:hypothetical protein [Halobacteriovorax marinus]|uniref:hypothetical protein n=1 Tax=Halobacteriovorax marinus TaxID=97084 RepID=UPI003A9595AD